MESKVGVKLSYLPFPLAAAPAPPDIPPPALQRPVDETPELSLHLLIISVLSMCG